MSCSPESKHGHEHGPAQTQTSGTGLQPDILAVFSLCEGSRRDDINECPSRRLIGRAAVPGSADLRLDQWEREEEKEKKERGERGREEREKREEKRKRERKRGERKREKERERRKREREKRRQREREERRAREREKRKSTRREREKKEDREIERRKRNREKRGRDLRPAPGHFPRVHLGSGGRQRRVPERGEGPADD
ncbi:hypothetical protein WMY93_024289 [Mugilogobius chulae]|uniref:Uncharacterized protein n=1 Tax=Mugilogobius chulae TaxID=88201 RepID=A0AAW0N3M6_9GOBI